MINFGAGTVICVPTRDAYGAAIAVPTPVKLLTLQEVGVDISVDLKLLHGEKKYAIAAAQGKGKIEVNAKYAQFSEAAVGLFLGVPKTVGLKAVVTNAAATIPASTPWTIAFGTALPGSGTFVADLGVYFSATGDQLTRVASAPVTGQYACSVTGVYTFASADANKGVVASYEYSAPTGGNYFNIANDQMGYTPKFALILRNQYDGDNVVLKLNQATSASLGLPLKSDDFAISDFSASVMEDAAGNIGYISMYSGA